MDIKRKKEKGKSLIHRMWVEKGIRKNPTSKHIFTNSILRGFNLGAPMNNYLLVKCMNTLEVSSLGVLLYGLNNPS